MKKTYCIRRRTYLGNELTVKTTTNKKKAKSYAFNWIRQNKKNLRENYQCKEYGQLKAIIYYVNDLEQEIFVKDYE